jgi:hypothetical protein
VKDPLGQEKHAPVVRSSRVPGRHARRTAIVNPSPAAVSDICAKRCTSCGKAMLSTTPALEETCPTVHPQPYARLRMESKLKSLAAISANRYADCERKGSVFRDVYYVIMGGQSAEVMRPSQDEYGQEVCGGFGKRARPYRLTTAAAWWVSPQL